jgi:hypothetical protein
MAEFSALDLSPAQISTLERLAKADFHFVTIERVERYLAVERNGFVALLEPSRGRFEVFGQAGYRIGEGIGMLVKRSGKECFVWKGTSVEATPELRKDYVRFKEDLKELLADGNA